MAIIPITVFGDKILRQKAKKINAINDEIISQIRDMYETMHNANGIGLAANQVSFGNSIFIVDISVIEEFKDIKPITFINPEIIDKSDDLVIFEEGCLSLPNLNADVERPELIKIKYLDTDENEQVLEADDLLARVIQHEFDHLLGKMIPDRVESDERKKLQKILNRIIAREEQIKYPVTTK